MKLVNHGFGEGPLERHVAFPVIAAGIGHNTFYCHRRVVAGPLRGFAVVSLGDRYGETIRGDENILAIEATTTLRGERTKGAVGINLPGLEVGDKDMQVVIGALPVSVQSYNLCRPCVASRIK